MQYLREREIESRGSDFVAQIRANVLALTSHGSPVKQLRRSAKQGGGSGSVLRGLAEATAGHSPHAAGLSLPRREAVKCSRVPKQPASGGWVVGEAAGDQAAVPGGEMGAGGEGGRKVDWMGQAEAAVLEQLAWEDQDVLGRKWAGGVGTPEERQRVEEALLREGFHPIVRQLRAEVLRLQRGAMEHDALVGEIRRELESSVKVLTAELGVAHQSIKEQAVKTRLVQTKLDAATLAASTREVELRKTQGQLEHEREQGVREAREAAQELARVRAESAQQVKSTQETVQSQADEQVRQLRVEVRELKFGLEKSAKESARLQQQRNRVLMQMLVQHDSQGLGVFFRCWHDHTSGLAAHATHGGDGSFDLDQLQAGSLESQGSATSEEEPDEVAAYLPPQVDLSEVSGSTGASAVSASLQRSDAASPRAVERGPSGRDDPAEAAEKAAKEAEETARLRQWLEDAQLRLSEAEEQARSRAEEVAARDAQIATMGAEMERLQQQLQALQAAENGAAAAKVEADEESAGTKEGAAAREQRGGALAEDRAWVGGEVSRLHAQLAEVGTALRAECKALCGAVGSSGGAGDEARGMREEQEAAAAELRVLLKGAQEELLDAKRFMAVMQQDTDVTKQRLDEAEAARSRAQQDADEAAAQLAAAGARAEAANEQCRALRATLESQGTDPATLEGAEAQRQARREQTRALEELAVLYNNFGATCKRHHDIAKAITMFRRALALREQLQGDAAVATTAINLGSALLDSGAMEESEALFRRALALRVELFGEDHDSTQTAMQWLERWRVKSTHSTSRAGSAASRVSSGTAQSVPSRGSSAASLPGAPTRSPRTSRSPRGENSSASFTARAHTAVDGSTSLMRQPLGEFDRRVLREPSGGQDCAP